MLVNANDRIIRCYHLDDHDAEPRLRIKFQDLVNRIQWNQVCFSADGEFVIGGKKNKNKDMAGKKEIADTMTRTRAEHNIHIWDKNMGNLVKILEGPKEPLDDLAVKKKIRSYEH